MKKPIAIFVLIMGSLAIAQESSNFKMNEHVFNAGGHPFGGTVLTSSNYRITLDAIGDSLVQSGMRSASYRMDGSFVLSYPPPGEVHFLRFLDKSTLEWNPESSVGHYNLYRDLLSNLSGLGYGICEQEGIVEETTVDPALPPVAAVYFYIVTAENRIHEEGIKGRDSLGQERPNPIPCP